MKRRDFLGISAIGAGAIAVGGVPQIIGQEVKTDLPDAQNPVGLVQLTKDIKCSRIGFGTGMSGGNRQSDMVRAGWTKSIELLRYGYDLGIRLFDCADMYGTHDIVARAMAGKDRSTYTIITKVWLQGGGIPEKERLKPEETATRLLRELRTDYIDLLQIHCMQNANWTTQFADAMESMEKLKKEGKIRAHGISSHSNAATELAAKTPWCDAVHIRINSEGLHMDGPRDNAAGRVEDTVRTTKLAHDAGKGTIAMKVLGQGEIPDPAIRKKSTAFVTKLDCIDVLIAAFAEKEHITEFIDNVAAALKQS